jgi:hypothetical protein
MMELQNNRDLNSTAETKVKHEDEGEEISSNDNAMVSSEVNTEKDCKTEPVSSEVKTGMDCKTEPANEEA